MPEAWYNLPEHPPRELRWQMRRERDFCHRPIVLAKPRPVGNPARGTLCHGLGWPMVVILTQPVYLPQIYTTGRRGPRQLVNSRNLSVQPVVEAHSGARVGSAYIEERNTLWSISLRRLLRPLAKGGLGLLRI